MRIWRVRGAADRRACDDRVLEASTVDVEGFMSGVYHLDRSEPCLVGDLRALSIGRWNGRAARQRHAKSLRECIHCRSPCPWCCNGRSRGTRCRDFHELTRIDPASRQLLPRMPVHRSRTGALSLPPTVEHWSARENDGGTVDSRPAIKLAGVVLSHPVMSTTPSRG